MSLKITGIPIKSRSHPNSPNIGNHSEREKIKSKAIIVEISILLSEESI